MPKLTQAKIREMAVLHITHPQKWSKDYICQYWAISPAKLDEIMRSSTWLEIAPVLHRVEAEKQETADQVWHDDHLNKLQDWQDTRYKIGRLCEGMSLELFKELTGFIKGDVDVDVAKAHSIVYSNMSKAIVAFDNQARTNITEALSLDSLLALNKELESPKQLSLFNDN